MARAELLTAGEAARRLGVHPSTIRRWADAGLLQADRLPGAGHRRIPAGEIARARLRAERMIAERKGIVYAIRPSLLEAAGLAGISGVDRPRAEDRVMSAAARGAAANLADGGPAGHAGRRLAAIEASALTALALTESPEHAAALRIAHGLASAGALGVTTVEQLCDAHRAIASRTGAPAAAVWLTALGRSGIGVVCPGARELTLARKAAGAAGGVPYPLAAAILHATARRLGGGGVWTYDAASAWIAVSQGFQLLQ